MTDTRSIAVGWLQGHDDAEAREVIALVIAWSAAEPHRVGEVALLDADEGPWMLGRGGAEDGDEHERLSFVRQRPGVIRPMPAIEGPAISRDQLLIKATEGGLEVERKGRCPVSICGTTIERGVIRPGETLALKHQLVLYCTRRPAEMPPLLAYPIRDMHEFGKPDAHGIVGESAAVWELRDQLAFSASADAHVLLLGESGSGKELAAQTIHALSARSKNAMVSRNAATFPPGIIDAELFGNVKDYPNPGMEARGGVIGEADKSSLFLDEISELPVELQAHILRVLDAGGEYQRLGDAQMRRADLRLIAATNRDPSELKHDLLARFTLRVGLPGLGDRRDDIPLIVDLLLREAVKKSAPIGERFFIRDGDDLGPPRIDPDLVEALLRHELTHHVRELDTLLWQAIGASKGKYIAFSDKVKSAIKIPEALPTVADDLSEEVVRSCLERHDGKVARAYKELGLKSRYALYRLMKKYGIEG
jgi:two-component system nitrogen regulation response regulator GlnG/two-component system response regulator HydG